MFYISWTKETIREIMLGPSQYHPALARNSDAGLRGSGFQVWGFVFSNSVSGSGVSDSG